MGVCFCRLYLGRHSVDQIVLGLALGLAQAHFFHFFMKPRWFDPYFRTDHELHAAITEEEHWYAFKIGLGVCAALIVQCVSIYLYVDWFVSIPQDWINQIRSICPHMKKVDFLHYQGPAMSGYNAVIPAAFFWNAFARSEFGRRFYPKINHLDTKRSLLEICTRLSIVFLFDNFSTHQLPLLIYSTKDLDMHQDFMVKRAFATIVYSLAAQSPFENYLQLSFRSPGKL